MRIIKDGLHYPVEAFRTFHPEVQFSGSTPSKRVLEANGWKILRNDPEPEVLTGQVAERGPVEIREGDPYWTWIVRDETPNEVSQRRALMKASRAKFALASFSAGIVTEAEAEAWAGGTALPQIVTDSFAANIADPTERLATRIEALTTANVHRTNPLIVMLQADLGLTDEQADALFD